MSNEAISIHADTTGLKRLSKKLADSAPAARKVAQKAIRAAAVVVEKDAEKRAAFSPKIANSGKVRMAGFNAAVTFGGGDAWYAVPIENKGQGFVSHPTFGHDPVTNKNSHAAFLAPAFAAHAEEFIDVLTEAVTDAIGDTLDF